MLRVTYGSWHPAFTPCSCLPTYTYVTMHIFFLTPYIHAQVVSDIRYTYMPRTTYPICHELHIDAHLLLDTLHPSTNCFWHSLYLYATNHILLLTPYIHILFLRIAFAYCSWHTSSTHKLFLTSFILICRESHIVSDTLHSHIVLTRYILTVFLTPYILRSFDEKPSGLHLSGFIVFRRYGF